MTAPAQQQAPARPFGPPPDPTAVRVRRRTSGTGPRMLLLHGLAASDSVWDACLGLLPADCEVWTAQLPWRGEGTSDWARHPDPGHWLRQALDAVPGGPQVVLAHSMSATALLDVLDRAQDAPPGSPGTAAARGIGALVLVSPFFRRTAEEFDWATLRYSVDNFHLIMEEGIRVHSGGRVAADLRRAMGERVRDYVGPYGWVRFIDLYLRTPALRLSGLTVPTLVLSGVHDTAAAPAESQVLAASLPEGRVHLLPGSGHFPMIEEAEAFAACVRDFLGSPACSRPRHRT